MGPEFETALNDWRTAAEAMIVAIEKRRFKRFLDVHRDGRKAFMAIKGHVRENSEKPMAPELKNAIMAVMDRWQEALRLAAPWKEEMKALAQRKSQSRVKEKKISRAYSAASGAAGRHMRIKVQ